MKSFIEKLLWIWKRIWGTCYIMTPVKEGLDKDQLLFYGHKIYYLEQEQKEEE